MDSFTVNTVIVFNYHRRFSRFCAKSLAGLSLAGLAGNFDLSQFSRIGFLFKNNDIGTRGQQLSKMNLKYFVYGVPIFLNSHFFIYFFSPAWARAPEAKTLGVPWARPMGSAHDPMVPAHGPMGPAHGPVRPSQAPRLTLAIFPQTKRSECWFLLIFYSN